MEGKWTRALLNLETRSLFDEVAEHDDVHRFEDIAKVDVGIVTGANKFFLVSDEVVKSYKLAKWAHPMFGRSEHCPGVIYDDRQHAANATKGNPTNFLWFIEDRPRSMRLRRLTSSWAKREPSYTLQVPCPLAVVYRAVGLFDRDRHAQTVARHAAPHSQSDRRLHDGYRLPYPLQSRGRELVGCFINPLTALSAELEGRHYGGGVLELIPSEIERLTIPLPAKVKVDLVDLDKAIRTLPTHQVLSRQGKIVLGGLGLSRAKQECVLEGWRKLRDRRHRTSSEPLAEEA